MESQWQERSARIIARVLAAYPEADEKTLRFHLRCAYPHDWQRTRPEYRTWCAELRAALDARFRRQREEHWAKQKRDEQEAAGQLRLLE